jgi:hypothetical protein
VALGESDAHDRWIGIRRHQAVLIVLGLGLMGDWTVRAQSLTIELVVGVALLGCAVPARDGLTSGEQLSVVAEYLLRPRWHVVAMEPSDIGWDLRARGSVVIRGYELEHRGRLDLSGTDFVNAERLCELANGLSMRGESSHVSVHVSGASEGVRTLMTLASSASACEGWKANDQLVRDVVGFDDSSGCLGLLERWSYVRTRRGLVRVLRVRDFTAVTSGRALLEQLQQNSPGVATALHFDVVEGGKAQRMAARAVHRMGSDGAASRAAGFRRTARSVLSIERVGQREDLVASGKALLRIGVFVTVRARSLDELRVSTERVVRTAEQSGLRVERGAGRQIPWFCFQLPGGPGW